MRVADLDYQLPPDLIAQRPSAERDGARLLVVRREGFVDTNIRDLPTQIRRGALLVVNDTRVVPARLYGTKVRSGGRVELLLSRGLGAVAGSARFEALGRASKRLSGGTEIAIGTKLLARVLREPSRENATIEVELQTLDGSSVESAIEAEGHVPLPPYIERADDSTDRERYQTIFAREPGAIAAPTAGLHLSERAVEELRVREIEIERVTLHVGLGTFQPVTAIDLDDHPMHAERFQVSERVVAAVERARARGAPVVAVGTTVARTLESARDTARPGHVRAAEGETRLLIQPGYEFGVVDSLLTNFHLPKSTLLAMVSALGGTELVLRAYAHAVRARYRFYSYGDAMLLSRGGA